MSADTRGENPLMGLGDANDHSTTQRTGFKDLYGLAPDTSTTQDDAFAGMVVARLSARKT